MNRLRMPIKAWLLVAWIAGGLLIIGAGSFSTVAEPEIASAASASQNPDDYIGSEACSACHLEAFESFHQTAHAKMSESKFETDMSRGCESCHGPGKEHVLCMSQRKEAMDQGLEPPACDPKIHSFKDASAIEISDTCLQCHANMGEEHGNYRRGEHWRNDVGCVDCHDPHGTPVRDDRVGSQTLIGAATEHKPDWSVKAMLKHTEPRLCLQCHNEIRSQFTMPFRHKVLEGTIDCSDCHNPHGGFELRQTRLTNGTDQVCMKCHTDKQGPFAFEHAPLRIEGCTACHFSHGSANPRMLKRADVFALCVECHSDAHAIGAPESPGAPGTPSFHNLALEKYRNCTTCHVTVHGSMSHPLFFR